MYCRRMGLAHSVFLHSSLWVVLCGRSVCDPVGPGYCLWGLKRDKCVKIVLGDGSDILVICVKILLLASFICLHTTAN